MGCIAYQTIKCSPYHLADKSVSDGFSITYGFFYAHLAFLCYLHHEKPTQILFSLTQGAKLNLNIFLSLTSNPQEVPLLPNSVWPAAVPCFGNQLATKLVINFNAANLNLFSGPEFQRKHFGVFHRTWNEILDSDQKTTIENIWRGFMGEIKYLFADFVC